MLGFRIMLTGVLFLFLSGTIVAQEDDNWPRLLTTHVESPSNNLSHVVTVENSSGSTSTINNPLINNNPNAILFLTPNQSTFGASFSYVNEAVGVWQNAAGQWTIYNQDISDDVPLSSAFNVQVQGLGANVFIHKTTLSNILHGYSYVDHPLSNGNPDALLFITPNLSAGNVRIDTGQSVFYDPDAQKWAIYNHFGITMPPGAAFNVQIHAPSSNSFVTTLPYSTNIFPIDHPLLNDNIYTQFIVTQNMNPPDQPLTFNNHHIGVYHGGGYWGIISQDLGTMPQGASFNVHILGTGKWVFSSDKLVNGGFEVPGNTATKAFKWSTTLTNNRRVCNTYFPRVIVTPAGECAFLFTGKSGVTGKITQSVSVSPGTNVSLSLLAQGLKLKQGASVTAVITMTDGSTQKLSIPSNQLNAGTYTYKSLSSSKLLPLNAVKMKVTIQMNGTSGKLWVDNVRIGSY